ncbi:hypothetical protein AUK40_00215 [Candidatus Wirthbacteria bacterium CG2_30_54_11]|uniref:Epoxyqueuosine reductase QueH n=1 Tax=Candidatus Wirthbacteria bacterium CG2_30_54_11 TaxID=1817892 RepID=A0A1J5ITK1_9BACT|nr:MAG: hypothetical protein AUK40_00215 [Candidatus Wirthbacteria bacterium CG2_30_54_11]
MKNKPTLLLHICCAPCSTTAIERLKDTYELTGFFYNPNIHPAEERVAREQEFTRLLTTWQIPAVTGTGDGSEWFTATEGMENEPEGGPRCPVCYRLRLEATAREASARGITHFATTLTISPQKNADTINAIGVEVGQRYGVTYLASNFKKQNGFGRSVELSREHGLYRQDYCGCMYSQRDSLLRENREKPCSAN